MKIIQNIKPVYLILFLVLAASNVFSQAPVITTFSPGSGPIGTTVTITGTNFNTTPASNIVFFGATMATVTAGSSTSLTVTVPAGATYQPISVLNSAVALSGYSAVPFITTFSPNKGGLASQDLEGKVDLSAGFIPYSIVVGDLDGDGKADLVVTNIGSNTISVFRNTSSNGSISSSSFAAKVDFATGISPLSAAIGDIDGDGKADIVVISSSGNYVSVLRNISSSGSITSSSFAANVDFTTGSAPYSVAIGDLDGDGKADLAVANFGSSSVSILRNTSTSGSITSSSFAAKVDFATGGSPYCVAIGDLDGDGKADLAVTNSSFNTISILRNSSSNGSITSSSFEAKVDFATGEDPYSVAIGDLDGDGKADLAFVNNSSNSVSVLRNISTSGSIISSSFEAKVDLTTGSYPRSVAINDLDGDGKVDLAVSNAGSNTISVFRNISSSGSISVSSFVAKVDFTTNNVPISVAIGDLDGDGKADLAVTHQSSNTISIIRNNPIFPPVITSFSPTSGPIGTTVTITGTNFNTTPASNIVFFGATRATVTAGSSTSLTVTVPVGATYQPISILNSTSAQSGYSALPFITTFSPNKGSISAQDFTAKVDFAAGDRPNNVAIGDLDGDGKADLAVVNQNSSIVSIFRNTSSNGSISASSFGAQVDFRTGDVPYSVAIGDLDGDGKADLAVTNVGGNSVSVFHNASTSGSITSSSFTAKVDFATGTNPISVAIGDLNGDGKADLAVTNAGSNSVSVLRNTSSSGTITISSFAGNVDFATGTQPYSVGIADLDGDGKADLAVANISSHTISIFRNTSSNGIINTSSFTAKVDFTTGNNPRSVAIGDLDGDGKVDLAVATSGSSTISIFRNTSSNGSITSSSFAAKVDFVTVGNSTAVAIGDLDGDGKADLAVANVSNQNISIFRNTSSNGSITSSSFAAKVDLTTGDSPYSLAIGDLDGDGKADLAVTNQNSATISILRNSPIFPPVITSFSPSSGPIGTPVTITGTNFNATPASNIVFFGATMATVTAGSTTSLTVTVPAGATYQPISVLNSSTALTAYSAAPFITTFSPNKGAIAFYDFTTKVDFTTGTQPVTMAIGDLDGDGKADLAVVNSGSNTVSVFRNISSNGSISASSFAAKVDFITGTSPYGVAIGDLDGDGKADLVVTNSIGNNVSVFRNTSSNGIISASSFDTRVNFTTGTGPYGLAIGDLDGDGKAELAVANVTSNTVSVLGNTSSSGSMTSSSFAPKVDFATGNQPFSVAISDLDGDGKADLAVTNSSSASVSVFRNRSVSGGITVASFVAKVDLATGNLPLSVAIGDLDGDGKADLAVTNAGSNSVSIIRNVSSSGSITISSFATKVDFTTGSSPIGVAIGDIDGDGKAEVTVANQASNTISVLRNTSTNGSIISSSFAAKMDFTTGSEPRSVVIGDLDGDGKPDLTLVNNASLSVSIIRYNPLFPPVITSFSPASGPMGTTVTIIGTNFNTTPASNIVFFGATMATVTAGSSTSLTVTVPAGATYQPISVLNSASALSGYSAVPFSTTFTPNTGSITAQDFAAKVDFSTSDPFSIAIGDLDGDGKSDMVVANNSSHTVSVFRNTSSTGSITSSSFAAKVDFATGTSPTSVAIGDLDGDGKADLAVVNLFSHTVSVLHNTSISGSMSSSSFAAKVDFAAGSQPNSVAISDLDGDGKADLAVTNGGSASVSVFRNTSASGSITSSSFAAKVDFTTGSQPISVAIADLDGDGKADLAVANGGNTSVSLFRNTSSTGSLTSSSFASKVDFATGSQPRSIAIGDLDKDGKADLAVVNFGNASVSVLRNTSTIGSMSTSSFAAKVDFTAGSQPIGIAIGDLDGDGKADLAISNSSNASVSVLRNISASGSITSSSFAPKVDFTSGSQPRSIAIGDLDGDGKAELAVANYSGASVSLLRNSPLFPPVITSFSPASGPIGTTVTITGTNFNTTPASNVVFFGATMATVTAGNTTSLTVTVPAGATYQPISVLNSANALSGYSAAPFITTFSPNKGSIAPQDFTAKVDFTTGTTPFYVAIGDLDGDGKADLAVANDGSNTISVFRNTSASGSVSASSFATKVDFATGNVPRSLAIGDLDGDGKADLVVVNSSSNTVSVLRNISTTGSITSSSFAAKVDFTTGNSPRSVAIGDLDGDGKADLVVTNTANLSVSVFRNTSSSGSITSSSFAAKVDFTTGTAPFSVAIGDLDGDGKADLAVANTANHTISIFRNTSSNGSIISSSFAAKVDFVTGNNPYSVTIGDLDGDGKADLAVANTANHTISIFRNTSSNGSITSSSFASKVDFVTGTNPQSINIGDLDGDGKADLAVANINSASVSVFRNTSTSGSITSSSFAAKVDLTTGSSPGSLAIGDLDGDGKADLAVANQISNSISIFRNNPLFPPLITSFSPTSGPIGTTVTITGSNFTTASAVGFGGTAAASFAVISANSITAVTAAGTSGDVSVTTSAGTATVGGFTFLSPDATLSALALSSGVLSPVFSGAGISYTSAVANNISSITLSPTASQSSSTIKVNTVTVASGTASGSIALAVGVNTITTEVTAPDGTTLKTYTLVINRAPSADATLSALALSSGVLSPVFSGAGISYTSAVANNITSITLSPTASQSSSTIKVNTVTVASGTASGSIALAVGANTITTEVTAPDGTTLKTYTLVITRAPSIDATLSTLVLSSGVLSPVFSGAGISYTSAVANNISSITLSPTASQSSSTIKVNTVRVASGTASGSIALAVGANTITAEVTAPDGTTIKTYTITITREASTVSANADLAGFTPSAGIFTPAFSPAITSYTATVPLATSSISFTALNADNSSTIRINGQIVAPGTASAPIVLNAGTNIISVVITAFDGTTKSYTFTVTRAAGSSIANITALSISAGMIDPVFTPAITSYVTFVNNPVSTITVNAKSEHTGSILKINNVVVSSGTASAAIPLLVGNNTIPVTISSEDGTLTKTYSLKVVRIRPDQTLTDQSGDASVNNSVTQVVVVSPTQPIVITVPAGTSISPSIAYGELISGGEGMIPQSTVNTSFAKMEIPAATRITASGTGWNGVLTAPTISSYNLPKIPGQIITTGLIIEVGSPDYSLSFDKAVRLALKGQAGMRVARVHGNVFTEILMTGPADNQAAGNALPADGTFKIINGSDLVIWTKVFSKFITFSQITDLDVTLVSADVAELTPALIKGSNPDLTSISAPLTLPVSGTFGSAITWVSSSPTVISTNGKTVIRPLFGSGAATVTLTATITKGLITETKAFTLIVPELPNQAPTMSPIANQTMCYTPGVQKITLTGITAGPEAGQTTTLSVESSNPAVLSGLAVNSTTGVITFAPANASGGTTTITVTVKDNSGTANGGSDTFSRTFSVIVNPLPSVMITSSNGSAQVSKGLALTLTASGGSVYSWANSSGIIGATNSDVLTIRPTVTTNYTVTVTNSTGCVSTQSVTISVMDDYLALEVNNIMSVNGDGVNDYLVIKNLDMYPDNILKIFDVAGRLLYSKQNYSNDWDGTYEGSALDEGTYFYIIDFGQGNKVLKGFVSIVN